MLGVNLNGVSQCLHLCPMYKLLEHPRVLFINMHLGSSAHGRCSIFNVCRSMLNEALHGKDGLEGLQQSGDKPLHIPPCVMHGCKLTRIETTAAAMN